MSTRSLNSLVDEYKGALANGNIQTAYQSLVAIVQGLRTEFSKKYRGEYKTANVLHGYIDYTYFYLQNEFLKQRKLKLAVVLNHKHANFELWLLGQTKEVQVDYWHRLKALEWVNAEEMPEYSIFEIELLATPDFDNRDQLFAAIRSSFELFSARIFRELRALEKS